MKVLFGLVALCSVVTGAGAQTAPAQPASVAKLESAVFEWKSLKFNPSKTGSRVLVFDAPTQTLDKLHLHISTLNPGQNTGELHRHPQEEVVIIKEGTLEVNIDGRKQTVGPGSMIFFSVNENENMTNIGTAPATYYVLQWFTPLTPKK
jgi:quercetin dioxygenase-like cupin family protein